MYPSESGRPPLEGSRSLCGYALRWGVPSTISGEPGGDFSEVFLAGSLSWPSDLPICTNHDRDDLVARLGAGATIVADAIGLFLTVEPNSYDVIAGVRTGAYRGWSISFAATDEHWSRDETGRRVRTVRKAWLPEISIVTKGAHSTDLGLGNKPGIWAENRRAE